MATKRPNDSDDHVGGKDDCGKMYIQGAKRQKKLDEYDFKKIDIPKIQGDKEITPKEENMHVGEVTKGDNFQNHNIINPEKDQSKSGDYDSKYSCGREKGNVMETDKKSEQSHKDRSELKDQDYEHSNAFKDHSHKDKESKHSHRSRSTGEKSRHSGKHKKHTEDKDSKSSSRSESTDEKSRYSHKHESRSKSEDSKSSNGRELTDEKPRHSYTYESEQRSGKHESEPSQKVEISPMKYKGDFKEEKSLDNSYHREEKKNKLDHLKFENTIAKFEHTEDLKDSHQNESTKDKSKHSDKHSQRTKDEDSGRSHRIESPDKKSSHSHKSKYIESSDKKSSHSHKSEYIESPDKKSSHSHKSEYIESPDKKSSHSHKSEYKPTPKHCDTTKDDFEFFFGMKSPFSQFHPARFVVRDVTYNCAEQFMMHQKAVMFKDRQIAHQILSEPKPLKQKRLGRKVRGFDPHVWGRKCVEIVKEGNIAKFSQNPHLEKQLIDTYPKIMAECSPRDCLWGIGLGPNNEKAWNVKTWRGKNLLGSALMEVRKYIMKAKGLIK